MRASPTAIAILLCVWAPCACASDSSSAQRVTELNNQGVAAARAGQFETGVAYLHQALQLDPTDALVKKNLSGILADWAVLVERAGEPMKSEGLLREAVQQDPANGRAARLLGDFYYFRRSQFDEAIAAWTQAHAVLAGDERRAVADRIAQARRDAAIERGFASHPTAHFDIRVQGDRSVNLQVLGALLEARYDALATLLGQGPPRLAVIVYAEDDLHRTYYQRDWALGFYDGRLRLAASELDTDLAPALIAHELAHAFLHHRYGNTLPTWIQEGFASFQEERLRARTDTEQRIEHGLRSGTTWVPLKWLDRRFEQPSHVEDVWNAYGESRLVVGGLLARYGSERFTRFLQALARGTAIEAAFDAAFAPERWAATDRNFLP